VPDSPGRGRAKGYRGHGQRVTARGGKNTQNEGEAHKRGSTSLRCPSLGRRARDTRNQHLNPSSNTRLERVTPGRPGRARKRPSTRFQILNKTPSLLVQGEQSLLGQEEVSD